MVQVDLYSGPCPGTRKIAGVKKTGHGESISSNMVGLVLRLPLPGKQIKVIKYKKFP